MFETSVTYFVRIGCEPTRMIWTTKVLRDSGMFIDSGCVLMYLVYMCFPRDTYLRHGSLDVHSTRVFLTLMTVLFLSSVGLP